MLIQHARFVCLVVLPVLMVAGCGGGGSSSGGSAGGPVDVVTIVRQAWQGNFELTEGPTGATGSGTMTLDFTTLLGESSVQGNASFTGDSCLTPGGGSIQAQFTGNIEPTTGNLVITIGGAPGATVTLNGRATQDRMQGTMDASGAACSNGNQDSSGDWFANPL